MQPTRYNDLIKLDYTMKIHYNIKTAAFTKSKYEFIKISGFREKVLYLHLLTQLGSNYKVTFQNVVC